MRSQPTRTPGLSMPSGSSAAFAARSARANGSGRSLSYHGRWSRPTAWWWVMVPPWARIASLATRLQVIPDLHLGATPAGRVDGEVRRRAVRVDVREPAANDGRRSGQLRSPAVATASITAA